MGAARCSDNSAPAVSNVTVSQRTDGSKKVDIRYNLSDADGDKCTISVQVSSDGGSTWNVPAVFFSGVIGAAITPGMGKLVVWDCAADLPGAYGTNYKAKITADDGRTSVPPDAVSGRFTIDNRFDYPVHSLDDDSLLGYVIYICGSDADPVNTGTGNFYHDETDLTIATRSVPLEFSRHYNSKDSRSGPLGIGWTHSYNIALTSGLGTGGDRVTVRWGDGRTDYWAENPGGGYDPNMPGLHDKLEKDTATWKVTRRNLDVYIFDNVGKLLSITDKNGSTFTLSYNHPSDPDLLTSISDPANRALTLSYTGDLLTGLTDFDASPRTVNFSYTGNRLTQVTDVLGNTINYTYDSNGYLETITDQRGITTVANLYDAEGRVRQQIDGNGNTTQFVYGTEAGFNKTTIVYPDSNEVDHLHSENSLLLMIRYPQGCVQYTYDDDMNRTQIIDRNGNVTNFEYDSRGNVLSTQEPNDPSDPCDGGVTTVEYEDVRFPDLPTSKTDALGRMTTWEYDPNGNCVREVDPNNFERLWTYNSFGQKRTETDKNSNATTYNYDANGLLTETVNAEGDHTWYDYDALWRLRHVTDGRAAVAGDPSHTTTYTYDDADRLTITQGPVITRHSYQYDKVGNRTQVINGRGYTTDCEYDNNSNLLRIERVDRAGPNQVTQYDYDNRNRKASMTDPNGNVTTYRYDALDRLIEETDPENKKTSYTYDSHGNVLSITDGSGVRTSYEYDALHRKVRQYDELDNHWSWQYDKLGNLTEHTDAKGNATRYEYDLLNRLVSVIDDVNNATEYAYDAVGNIMHIKDSGGKTISKKYYDKANRLEIQEDGLSNAYLYDYDGAGNLTSVLDPDSNLKTLIYDNENRLAEVHYPTGPSVTYSYDNNGNLTVMTDATGTTTYTYDAFDRLISSIDGFGKQVEYGYDIVGNRTSITYPADSTNPARTATYTYDKAGRLSAITDWDARVWDYAIDGAGRITELAYPSGVRELREYDYAGRLSKLEYVKSDATPLISYIYTRDAQGNPTDVNEMGTLQPDMSGLFGKTTNIHDNDNRLQSSTVPATYGYDNRGNLTSRVAGGVTTAFDYDYENRLISQATDGNSVQHVYGGQGNRVSRNDSGSVTHYVLDRGRGMSHILCETDAAGDIVAYYIHGPTTVGKIAADGSVRYYHTDAIGSVVALTDETESVTDKYAYTPFGIPCGKTGSTVNPFTYVGGLGVMAEADGLYFMRARFYDPRTGRFLGKDPVEGTLLQPMSLYRYNYAQGNPLVMLDPTGLVNYRKLAWGTVHTVGGVSGVAGSVAIGIVTSPTGIGAVACVGTGILSASTAWKGVKEIDAALKDDTSEQTSMIQDAAGGYYFMGSRAGLWGESQRGLEDVQKYAGYGETAVSIALAIYNVQNLAGHAGGGGHFQFTDAGGRYINQGAGWLGQAGKWINAPSLGVSSANLIRAISNVPAFYDPKLNVCYVNDKVKELN
jgi:RHS repeat-associated protein